MFTGDPADRDSWLLKNGDEVIARHHTDELRFLVHWSAEVFEDFDELKKNMDGTDDLTVDKAIDMLVDDLGKRASNSTCRLSRCTTRRSSAPSTPRTTSAVRRSTRTKLR